jgi:integrase
VRSAGADASVPLGNSRDGWDETRVEAARRQLLAKIELGLWTPRQAAAGTGATPEEPTIRRLATDWLFARELNPAIRDRTIELNTSQLTRYVLPFFGELKPSQISPDRVKAYRERLHSENAAIRTAEASGRPLRDAQTGRRLRTLSNESINKTLQVLAMILDDAEDSGWVDRNVARGRRMREPRERRRNRGALDVDEFLDLLEAADQLDRRHRPATLERGAQVRALRDEAGLEWKAIATKLKISTGTAVYLYDARAESLASHGPRRAIIATLGLAGIRVGELCALNYQDLSLTKDRLYINDAKTEAGIRSVDIHPRLREELTAYYATRRSGDLASPAFPTRTGTRRDRSNVLARVIRPAVTRANQLRADRNDPPIRAHVTPHAFRRAYITFMIAAGYDIPYVQAQVGHVDPSTTLGIYAQLMARRDRDELRAEIRELLGVTSPSDRPRPSASPRRTVAALPSGLEKAPKGPTLLP